VDAVALTAIAAHRQKTTAAAASVGPVPPLPADGWLIRRACRNCAKMAHSIRPYDGWRSTV
jgi:hypothetical protein